MATEAYIFDMDGTLMDTEVLWVDAVEAFMCKRKPAYTHQEAEALVYGRSWHDIYDDMMAMLPGCEMPIAAVEAEMAPLYQAMESKRDVRIHQSIDLLKDLATRHPVCIVSGSSRKMIAANIEKMGIGHAVSFYLGAEDYSPGKPDPACFLMAAERLGVAPKACLVFEDSEAGVLGARRAGMRAVAFARDGALSQDFSVADLVLSDLSEFDPAMLGEGG